MLTIISGGPDIQIGDLKERILSSDRIIAADSGADYLYAWGIVADEVVGDMDSVDRKALEWHRSKGAQIRLFPPEKDMTDLELCLDENSREEIFCILSLSGRPDHSMGHLMLLAQKAAAGQNLTATDGRTWIFPLKGPCEFVFPQEQQCTGSVISLFPILGPVKNVCTHGLYYPLADATLLPGSTRSISNCVADGATRPGLTIGEGVLLVMLVPD